MKRVLIWMLITVMAVSLAACKKEEVLPVQTSEPIQTVEATVEAEVPTAEPQTEEAVQTQEAQIKTHPLFADRRPFAMMVNNLKAGRPQSGLADAKVIYEILVEGRITRYLIVTDAQSGLIGPVRSARPAFIQIAAEYDAIYGHAGNLEVVQDIDGFDALIDWDQFARSGYHRTTHRKAPYNLYGDMEKLYAAVEQAGKSVTLPSEGLGGFEVYDTARQYNGGQTVNEISFVYGNSETLKFVYDPGQKTYKKYVNTTVMIDEQSKEEIEITNFIIIPRPHGKMPNGVHEKISYIGSGKAYYYVQGQVFEMEYTKTSAQAPMQFTFKDNGEKLILNPGLTFINIVTDQMEIKNK